MLEQVTPHDHPGVAPGLCCTGLALCSRAYSSAAKAVPALPPDLSVGPFPVQTPLTHPQPPKVRFETRVNMTCVGPTGEVDPRGFSVLARWNRGYTMETVLVELRREMASSSNRKAPQPPEGSTYR